MQFHALDVRRQLLVGQFTLFGVADVVRSPAQDDGAGNIGEGRAAAVADRLAREDTCKCVG
jgi:hypothetical protein